MRYLIIAILVFATGCKYGDPALRVVNAENQKFVDFPEKNVGAIESDSFHGIAFYPQIIVSNQGGPNIKACVRSYLVNEDATFSLSDPMLHDRNGKLIEGSRLRKKKVKIHSTHPKKLLKFKVDCLKAYTGEQLAAYASSLEALYLSFNVQVNQEFERTYRFKLEPAYVRYSSL